MSDAPPSRAFVVAAWVEVATLVVLVTNRLTVGVDAVASLVGPVHGTAYLIVVVLGLAAARAHWSARVVALVPGVGGLLSTWLRRRHSARTDQPVSGGP